MSWIRYEKLWEKVFHRTLPNGLQVMVIPRSGFTKKLAYFVTDFGAIDLSFTLNGEEVNLPQGTAHFLEHKLFDMPDIDVSAQFASLGASVNAFTSYDMTAYYFLCTQHFEENLALLVKFVSTPYFTEESVAKEQGIIGQEIGMNTDNMTSQANGSSTLAPPLWFLPLTTLLKPPSFIQQSSRVAKRGLTTPYLSPAASMRKFHCFFSAKISSRDF